MLGAIYSQHGNILFPPWELFIPTLGTFRLLGSNHAVYAKDDEWDGEDLSHIEWECGLERFLHFLGVFDEEAEGEDIRQTEAEIPACADLLWHALVEIPHNAKQDGVGDGLVKLSWVARHHVDTLEDKGPGHVCNLADNL